MHRRYPTGFVSCAARALLSLIVIPSVSAADAPADDLSFVVRIYGWIPSVDGDLPPFELRSERRQARPGS